MQPREARPAYLGNSLQRMCMFGAQDSTRTLLWKQDVQHRVRQTGPSQVSRICAGVQ